MTIRDTTLTTSPLSLMIGPPLLPPWMSSFAAMDGTLRSMRFFVTIPRVTVNGPPRGNPMVATLVPRGAPSDEREDMAFGIAIKLERGDVDAPSRA